jgi:trans-aconitate 2-methyltransferase
MTWDVEEYEAFPEERARPFFDLVARVRTAAVGRVLDLGCGTGALTVHLADRWPGAEVLGVDSSPEMLAAAAPRAREGLRFVAGDLGTYPPPAACDVIVSNAALHWVDDHAPLLDRLVQALAPGGSLAVQMPANFDAASHMLLAEVAADGPWADKLDGALANSVHPLTFYAEHLLAQGLTVDAWETVYLHLLPGDDAVLSWVRGAALRPVLALLSEDEVAGFIAAYQARLRAAYPRSQHGTLFPFRRIFFVARRPARTG